MVSTPSNLTNYAFPGHRSALKAFRFSALPSYPEFSVYYISGIEALTGIDIVASLKNLPGVKTVDELRSEPPKPEPPKPEAATSEEPPAEAAAAEEKPAEEVPVREAPAEEPGPVNGNVPTVGSAFAGGSSFGGGVPRWLLPIADNGSTIGSGPRIWPSTGTIGHGPLLIGLMGR